MSRTNRNLTRRSFILSSVPGSAWLHSQNRSIYAQTSGRVASTVRFKLVKELKTAYWRSFSPDSQRMCVTYSQKPVGKFVLRSDGNRTSVSHEAASGDELAILDLGSWREVSLGQVSGEPNWFEFSEDSKFLFGDVLL